MSDNPILLIRPAGIYLEKPVPWFAAISEDFEINRKLHISFTYRVIYSESSKPIFGGFIRCSVSSFNDRSFIPIRSNIIS